MKLSYNNVGFEVKMSLVIEEKEIALLPITVDPEILGGTPVYVVPGITR